MLVSYYITEMDHTYAINQDEENNETLWDHTYAKNLGVANNAISGPGKSEEEGMSGESGEVEVKVPRRRVPDLFLDEKTFILLQKSEKATYKQIVRKWTEKFKRKPPTRDTMYKMISTARTKSSIDSRKYKSGRKRSVRTPEIIEEILILYYNKVFPDKSDIFIYST